MLWISKPLVVFRDYFERVKFVSRKRAYTFVKFFHIDLHLALSLKSEWMKLHHTCYRVPLSIAQRLLRCDWQRKLSSTIISRGSELWKGETFSFATNNKNTFKYKKYTQRTHLSQIFWALLILSVALETDCYSSDCYASRRFPSLDNSHRKVF